MTACNILKTGLSPTHVTIQKTHEVESNDSRLWCVAGMKQRSITGDKKTDLFCKASAVL